MRFAGSDSAMQSMFGNMSKNTPGVLENLGTEARSSTRNAVTEGQFQIDKAKIDAEAIKKGAQIQASAMKSQNQSNMFNSILGAASTLAGGFGSMGGGGGGGGGSTWSGFNYSDFGNSMNANPFKF